MKKEFLEIGKFVGTHGVRGMVRIQPWSDDGEFLTKFKNFYLDNGKAKIKMNKITPHGNVVIAAVDGIDTIEDAEKLRNQVLYIKRADAKLPDGRYFVSEIIGAQVFDADTNVLLGTLTDVSPTGANDVWHIKSGEKEYLVPAISDVIVDVNIDNDIITIRPLKGIFDNED
ncbi:MAG: 16S rRNA processing protein RimM [Ruminococcaceae bacterium]|nr:16S rRNA processing protein RimM [Oscillospiraceae bacterium]